MTDIAERLRKQAWHRSGAPKMDAGHTKMLEWEAADEIERLRTENKMLELELAEAARHMDAQDEELKRLRALEFELRGDIALAPLSPKGMSDD